MNLMEENKKQFQEIIRLKDEIVQLNITINNTMEDRGIDFEKDNKLEKEENLSILEEENSVNSANSVNIC